MPPQSSLEKVKKTPTLTPRWRTTESQGLVEPLLSSWFDITNYSSVGRLTSWSTARTEGFPEDLRVLEELAEDERPINSTIKLRLYPMSSQRVKLEQMFATNRAVYNILVARSKEDCTTRLVIRGKTHKLQKMTLKELGRKYRPASQTGEMGPYFRNKKALERYLQVNDKVRGSAFHDLTKAVKSSPALFFELKKKDKKTTFPKLKFKSKIARSNAVERAFMQSCSQKWKGLSAVPSNVL